MCHIRYPAKLSENDTAVTISCYCMSVRSCTANAIQHVSRWQ